MSETVTIYGASDDLIEVEGRLGDEYGVSSEDDGYVLFSTGDLFHVQYGVDGRAVWTVEHTERSDELEVEHTPAPPGEDPDPYTDKTVVTGAFTWVDFWPTWPPEESSIRERLSDGIDELKGEALRAAYDAMKGR